MNTANDPPVESAHPNDEVPSAPPDKLMMWMMLFGLVLFGAILALDLLVALFRQ